jgi:protoporphyrinogen oxidase
VPCSQIKPEWGAQRIKGLSITKALLHAAKKLLAKKDSSIEQKKTETSLIDRFLYPKFGPGQMWEETARLIIELGGEIHMRHTVVGLRLDGGRVREVTVRDQAGHTRTFAGDFVISTMAIKDLIESLGDAVPTNVRRVGLGLMYRDFMTVGLLLNKLKITNETAFKTVNNIVPDNWIYIQEPDVKIGRLQIFNNWSPYLVRDPDTAWVGLEYFCNEGDELWSMADDQFARFAIEELARISIIEKSDVLDSTVIRARKAYPAYFGTYDEFDVLKKYFNAIDNLFLVGRNGMHKYNNQDHSMLTAMTAVDNIIAGITAKDNIWQVNTEKEYHEEKADRVTGNVAPSSPTDAARSAAGTNERDKSRAAARTPR